MMVERRSVDVAGGGGADGHNTASPVVSRERLDGNWSVEKVEVGGVWEAEEDRHRGNGGGEAIVEDEHDSNDRAKLLRPSVKV